jgi:hypothetical protein
MVDSRPQPAEVGIAEAPPLQRLGERAAVSCSALVEEEMVLDPATSAECDGGSTSSAQSFFPDRRRLPCLAQVPAKTACRALIGPRC